MNEAAESTEAQPGPVNTTEQAYLLIRQCLEHEPADSRGIIFASKEAVDIIAAAGGQVGQQLRGSPQGLLVAVGAKLKIGDWTMTSVYERPATQDEARAEFDRILAAMAPKQPEPEPVEESNVVAFPDAEPREMTLEVAEAIAKWGTGQADFRPSTEASAMPESEPPAVSA